MNPDERKALFDILKDVTDVKVTLARNTASLDLHMRRTDLLEAKVDAFWPKVLSAAGVLVGMVVGIAKLLGH